MSSFSLPANSGHSKGSYLGVRILGALRRRLNRIEFCACKSSVSSKLRVIVEQPSAKRGAGQCRQNTLPRGVKTRQDQVRLMAPRDATDGALSRRYLGQKPTCIHQAQSVARDPKVRSAVNFAVMHNPRGYVPRGVRPHNDRRTCTVKAVSGTAALIPADRGRNLSRMGETP
jgi:hypothetical protein